MEPISALLVLAGSHGAMALVKSLTGVDELGQLSGELVRALTASESRIDERLDRIESGLDELLEQSYSVSIRRGVRYLLDATGSSGTSRAGDLDRSRDAFVEATAAARSPLQQAIAERYLLLVLLGLGRQDAVPASLTRVEEHATASAFDALRTSEISQDATDALLRRQTASPGRMSGDDRLRQARYEVKQAAIDSISMSARLLAEMALLRPTLELPAVNAPPVEPIVDETVMTVTVKSATGIGRSGVTRNEYAIEAKGQYSGFPYWAFDATPERTLRLGSLTVTVSPEPAPVDAQHPAPAISAIDEFKRRDQRIQGHARVELRAPLPEAVAVVSNPTARTGGVDVNNGRLAAGATVAYVPLMLSAEGLSWIRITPQYIHRALIEVACRL